MGQVSSRMQGARNDIIRAGRRVRGAGSLPGFVVIGVQRGGTTTLFATLRRHPAVGDPLRKEIHYFDSAYARPLGWYRSFFPSVQAMRHRGERVTGEASPSYVFHPLVPERVAETLPGARFIVMLRDPVARAWSHHSHQTALGNETLSFEEAIDAEEARLVGEQERIASDPSFAATRFRRVSYLARGDYAPQLERWFSAVGKDRLLVLVSEEFFADPLMSFRGVERFLDLPHWENVGPITARYAPGLATNEMSDETRERLRSSFAPKIRRTEELLGRELPWPRPTATTSEDRPSAPAAPRGDSGS